MTTTSDDDPLRGAEAEIARRSRVMVQAQRVSPWGRGRAGEAVGEVTEVGGPGEDNSAFTLDK